MSSSWTDLTLRFKDRAIILHKQRYIYCERGSVREIWPEWREVLESTNACALEWGRERFSNLRVERERWEVCVLRFLLKEEERKGRTYIEKERESAHLVADIYASSRTHSFWRGQRWVGGSRVTPALFLPNHLEGICSAFFCFLKV